jgi:ATP-dependent DNA helicase RecG
MRPHELNPLFTDVTVLKGVGDKGRQALTRLLARISAELYGGIESVPKIPRIHELLFHLPVGVIDRRHRPDIMQLRDGMLATLLVTVEAHYPPPAGRRKAPHRVVCVDATGSITLAFFNAKDVWLRDTLPIGKEIVLSGKVDRFDGHWQMPHPDVIVPAARMDEVLQCEPVYPLTYALTNRRLASWTQMAIDYAPALPEWLDETLRKSKGWSAWKTALSSLHHPTSSEDVLPTTPARERLAYDEILAHQLALALVRRNMKKKAGVVVPMHSPLANTLEAALPFTLTEGQRSVIGDIVADMASGSRMLRLLQGDVGSGKTVVGLMAAAHVAELSLQTAFMAPTEILARQHYATLSRLLAHTPLKAVLLTGSLKASERKAALEAIASGSAQIVVGTHALFQSSVQFHALGLAVIDEQHRFGVAQRMALSEKGHKPHMLLMTATPIPRSLTMVLYGDMESSALTQKPIGRQAIKTSAIPLSRMHEVIEGLRRTIARGEKVYWICPLVAEGLDMQDGELVEATKDEPDIQAAAERHRALTALLGERVGLVHGQMKAETRQDVMQGFAGDAYDVLVATTVIEVGVDVPAATVIVIENAERFGLSQLHQLRGRVGRGDKPSSCVLLYHPRLSNHSQERLKIIREHTDGFLIAEEDLRLRGGGEILGTQQSGMPQFLFADPWEHRQLILTARDDVKLILDKDPELASERGKALRILLYLMGQDSGVKLLDGG